MFSSSASGSSPDGDPFSSAGAFGASSLSGGGPSPSASPSSLSSRTQLLALLILNAEFTIGHQHMQLQYRDWKLGRGQALVSDPTATGQLIEGVLNAVFAAGQDEHANPKAAELLAIARSLHLVEGESSLPPGSVTAGGPATPRLKTNHPDLSKFLSCLRMYQSGHLQLDRNKLFEEFAEDQLPNSMRGARGTNVLNVALKPLSIAATDRGMLQQAVTRLTESFPSDQQDIPTELTALTREAGQPAQAKADAYVRALFLERGPQQAQRSHRDASIGPSDATGPNVIPQPVPQSPAPVQAGSEVQQLLEHQQSQFQMMLDHSREMQLEMMQLLRESTGRPGQVPSDQQRAEARDDFHQMADRLEAAYRQGMEGIGAGRADLMNFSRDCLNGMAQQYAEQMNLLRDMMERWAPQPPQPAAPIQPPQQEPSSQAAVDAMRSLCEQMIGLSTQALEQTVVMSTQAFNAQRETLDSFREQLAALNGNMERLARMPGRPPGSADPETLQLLREIRDSIAALGQRPAASGGASNQAAPPVVPHEVVERLQLLTAALERMTEQLGRIASPAADAGQPLRSLAAEFQTPVQQIRQTQEQQAATWTQGLARITESLENLRAAQQEGRPAASGQNAPGADQGQSTALAGIQESLGQLRSQAQEGQTQLRALQSRFDEVTAPMARLQQELGRLQQRQPQDPNVQRQIEELRRDIASLPRQIEEASRLETDDLLAAMATRLGGLLGPQGEQIDGISRQLAASSVSQQDLDGIIRSIDGLRRSLDEPRQQVQSPAGQPSSPRSHLEALEGLARTVAAIPDRLAQIEERINALANQRQSPRRRSSSLPGSPSSSASFESASTSSSQRSWPSGSSSSSGSSPSSEEGLRRRQRPAPINVDGTLTPSSSASSSNWGSARGASLSSQGSTPPSPDSELTQARRIIQQQSDELQRLRQQPQPPSPSQIQTLTQQHEQDVLAKDELTGRMTQLSEEVATFRSMAADEKRKAEAQAWQTHNAQAQIASLQRRNEELQKALQPPSTPKQKPSGPPKEVEGLQTRADAAKDRISGMRKANADLAEKVASLEKQKDDLLAMNAALSGLNADLDSDKGRLTAEAEGLAHEFSEMAREFQPLQDQAAGLRSENNELRRRLNAVEDQARAPAAPPIILPQEGPTESERRMAAQARELDEAQARVRQLNEENQKLQKTQRASDRAKDSATGQVRQLGTENERLGDEVSRLQQALADAKDALKDAKRAAKPSSDEIDRLKARITATDQEAKRNKALLATQREALSNAQQQVANAREGLQSLAADIQTRQTELDALRQQPSFVDVLTLPENQQALIRSIPSLKDQTRVSLPEVLNAAQREIQQLQQREVALQSEVADATHLPQQSAEQLAQAESRAAAAEEALEILRRRNRAIEGPEERLEQAPPPSTGTSSVSSGRVTPRSSIVKSPTASQDVRPPITAEELSGLREHMEELEQGHATDQNTIAQLRSDFSTVEERLQAALATYNELTDEVLKRESAAAQLRRLEKGPENAAREMLDAQDISSLRQQVRDLEEQLEDLSHRMTTESSTQTTEMPVVRSMDMQTEPTNEDLFRENLPFPAADESFEIPGSANLISRVSVPPIFARGNPPPAPTPTETKSPSSLDQVPSPIPVSTSRRKKVLPAPPTGAPPEVPSTPKQLSTPKQQIWPSTVRGRVLSGSLTSRTPGPTPKLPDLPAPTSARTPRLSSSTKPSTKPLVQERPITPAEYTADASSIDLGQLADDPNFQEAIAAAFEAFPLPPGTSHSLRSHLNLEPALGEWKWYLDNTTSQDYSEARQNFCRALLPNGTDTTPTWLPGCPLPPKDVADFNHWRKQVGGAAWDALNREAGAKPTARRIDFEGPLDITGGPSVPPPLVVRQVENVEEETPAPEQALVSPQGVRTTSVEPRRQMLVGPQGEKLLVEAGDDQLPLLLPDPAEQQEEVDALFKDRNAAPPAPKDVVDRLRRTKAFNQALRNAITAADDGSSGSAAQPNNRLSNSELKRVLRGRLLALEAQEKEIPAHLLARIINFLRWSAYPSEYDHPRGEAADYDFRSRSRNDESSLNKLKSVLGKGVFLGRMSSDRRQDYVWEALREWDEDFVSQEGAARYNVPHPSKFTVRKQEAQGIALSGGKPHYLADTASTKAKLTPKTPPAYLASRVGQQRPTPSSAESPLHGRRLFSTPEAPGSTSTSGRSAKTPASTVKSPPSTATSSPAVRPKKGSRASVSASMSTPGQTPGSKGKTPAGGRSAGDDSPTKKSGSKGMPKDGKPNR